MQARHWFVLHMILLLIGVSFLLVRAQPPSTNTPSQGKLDGVWRTVSYKYGNATSFTDIPEGKHTRMKYFTGQRFIWVINDPKTRKIVAAAGGKYTFDGATLRETPQFGLGSVADDLRDHDQIFRITFDGDTFRQAGTLVFGGKHPGSMPIEEVWKRLK